MTRKERYAEPDKRANKMLYAVIEASQQKEFANDFHQETECVPNVKEAQGMSIP